MFSGRYDHTIDEKGRISIPVKFREILKVRYDERLMITTMDGCLYAYPYEEWKIVEDKAVNFQVTKPEDKIIKRLFFSGVMECSLDKLGRILLPPPHREYAGIQKDVIFSGGLERMEIWAKERFEENVIKAAEELQSRSSVSDLTSYLGI
jgi:MraZ protein